MMDGSAEEFEWFDQSHEAGETQLGDVAARQRRNKQTRASSALRPQDSPNWGHGACSVEARATTSRRWKTCHEVPLNRSIEGQNPTEVEDHGPRSVSNGDCRQERGLEMRQGDRPIGRSTPCSRGWDLAHPLVGSTACDDEEMAVKSWGARVFR